MWGVKVRIKIYLKPHSEMQHLDKRINLNIIIFYSLNFFFFFFFFFFYF